MKMSWAIKVIFTFIHVLFSTFIFSFQLLLNGIKICKKMSICGLINLSIHPSGKINFGENLRINSNCLRNLVGNYQKTTFVVGKNAMLEISDNVAISNTIIVCHNQIIIGKNVFIGGDCKIYDTDFHALAIEERIKSKGKINTKPIHIMENSFIGAHSIILKGVTIGQGAIVGAGSVITKSIPDFEIWAGNPAKKIGDINR